jgi:nucleotide-binding universal stress UspA family protein
VYKHILIPTDGSELSKAAVENGVALAKALGARVTVLTVLPPWHAVAPAEVMVAFPENEYRQGAEAAAARYLDAASSTARDLSVACDTLMVEHERPWQAIIEAAKANDCDLIVMASHGRKGIGALLLGSETQNVLTHSRIPVLVHR